MDAKEQLEAAMHKRARGYILKCLNFYPGEGSNALLVADFVRNAGLPVLDSDVITQLNYLKSKGYVEVREICDTRLCNEKIVVAEITSKGIDLLEASISEDPGITLPKTRCKTG
ncbi:MAG: hypothetical protein AB1847_16720 [bacterium]